MEKIKEHQLAKEPAIDIVPEKQRFMTCWMQLLALIAVFCLFNQTPIALMLAVGIGIVLWRVSKKRGLTIARLVLPTAMRQRFVASNFYRIFLRGPVKTHRNLYTILLFLNFWPLFLIVTFMGDWFVPILDLDEMQTYNGVIEKITKGGRKSMDRMVLRTTSGERIEMFYAGPKEAEQYIEKLVQKDEVKIWTNITWHTLFRPMQRTLKQLQYKDYIVKKYDKERHASFTWFGRISSAVCILWLLFFSGMVWILFHNYKEEQK